MKNTFVRILFALFVLFSLYGCGGDEPDPKAGTESGTPADAQAKEKTLDEKTLQLLMKYGLHRAAAHGDLEAVQAFISQGAPLEEYDIFHGQTPLMWAAKQGHPPVCEALLSAGVNPNKTTKVTKQVALHFAAYNNQVEVIKVLLKWKADPNAKDWDDNTPLHDAAENGSAEVVTVLLSAPNIDITITNEDGKTAKEVAKDDTIKALFPSE